jgi:hypothetical protein
MSGDEVQMLNAWLTRIETKLDKMMILGCSRAPTHADHEARIRAIETIVEQGRGASKLMMLLSALLGGSIATVIGRICK